jgi:stage III sporulation protein AE
MRKLSKYKVLFLIIFLIISKSVWAEEVDVTEIGNSLEIDKYLEVFENYINENNISDFEPKKLYSDLITGNKIDFSNLFDIIISNLFIQVKESTKSVLTLVIIIIIMAILSSMELNENSDVVKISKLVLILSVSSILLKNYIEIVDMFKQIITILSYAMQIVSTFLTGILVASGKITTTGIIQPLILFVSSFICVITEYVVIPFFTISIALNVVSKISDNIKLDKLSNMFRKSSLYIFNFVIAIYILILSMETTITKSIDNIYFKTTQNIVSDVVPVVGKFLSDSLDTVIGATELIGKVGGVVALISILLVVSIPITKILVVFILYKALSAFSEPINEDKLISDFIDDFSNVYKDMLGILIGISILFIMTTGIIMKMISSISG